MQGRGGWLRGPLASVPPGEAVGIQVRAPYGSCSQIHLRLNMRGSRSSFQSLCCPCASQGVLEPGQAGLRATGNPGCQALLGLGHHAEALCSVMALGEAVCTPGAGAGEDPGRN